MEEEQYASLGTFELFSRKALLTDPCYEVPTMGQIHLENIQNGTWEGYACYEESSGRVAELVAFYQEWQFPEEDHFNEFLGGIGVDSAQAGLFDLETYRKETGIPKDLPKQQLEIEREKEGDQFYGVCCDLALGEKQAGVTKNGVVSSTGWGDGVYPCLGIVDPDGFVMGVRLIFIEEEDFDLDNEFFGLFEEE